MGDRRPGDSASGNPADGNSALGNAAEGSESAAGFASGAFGDPHDPVSAARHSWAGEVAADDTVQFRAIRDEDPGAGPRVGAVDPVPPVAPQVREAETPTEQIPVLRLSDRHEELLARLLSRSGEATAEEPAVEASTGHRVRRSPGTRHVWRRAVLVAASFLAVLALSTAAVAGLAYKKYNGQIKREAVLQTTDPNIVEPAKQQNAENFLIIGSDHRAKDDPGYDSVGGARSDTTIVVHLSPDHQKATVVSIPRDSFVDIPACKGANGAVIPAHQELFNSAFSEGGASCTIATVQKITGIAITHYIEVDFDGFQQMVSAMGRVRVCSPEAVFDQDSGLRLKKGMNSLNGTQALAYVRARHNLGDGSDLGRIKRQQTFMSAVLRQAMQGTLLSNPVNLTRFLDAATKSITVDKGTTFGDLRTLADSMQGLDPKRVLFYTAPIANSDYSPPGFNYSGKVLLDDAAGKILYTSIINDSTPVWVTGDNTTTAAPTGAASTTSPAASSPSPDDAPTDSSSMPKPNTNAANTSCTI